MSPSHPAAGTGSHPHRGTLTLFTGPMFAGKSAALVRAAQAAGPDTLVLRPLFDHRDPMPRLRSRDGTEVAAVPVSAWPDAAEGHPHVVIDEVQFLVPPHYGGDVVADIERALVSGISITVGGLDTDYHRRPFAVLERLCALADEHHALLARCHLCGAPARWTAKKRDTGALLEPGDTELYEARCDAHWAEPAGSAG